VKGDESQKGTKRMEERARGKEGTVQGEAGSCVMGLKRWIEGWSVG
jgi:hypothetical protein